ncbi:MAG: MGMT family protein, partial [Candidatus Omnitrophota bacterium]
VGQALNKNPFPLLIPCHRVIAQNGTPGGFAFGVKTKKKLLLLEKEIVQQFCQK